MKKLMLIVGLLSFQFGFSNSLNSNVRLYKATIMIADDMPHNKTFKQLVSEDVERHRYFCEMLRPVLHHYNITGRRYGPRYGVYFYDTDVYYRCELP